MSDLGGGSRRPAEGIHQVEQRRRAHQELILIPGGSTAHSSHSSHGPDENPGRRSLIKDLSLRITRRHLLFASAVLALTAWSPPRPAHAAARKTVHYYYDHVFGTAHEYDVILGLDGKNAYLQLQVFLPGQTVPTTAFTGLGRLSKGKVTVDLHRTVGQDGAGTGSVTLRKVHSKFQGSFNLDGIGGADFKEVALKIERSAAAHLKGTWSGPFPSGGSLQVTFDTRRGTLNAQVISAGNTLLDVTGRWTPVVVKQAGGAVSHRLGLLPDSVTNNVPELQNVFEIGEPDLLRYQLAGQTLQLRFAYIPGNVNPILVTLAKQ